MKLSKPVCLLLLAATSHVAVAADEERSCNMLGREIALRASEQLDTSIDAGKRNQLAEIAAEVCLQYQDEIQASVDVPTVAPMSQEAPIADPEEEADSGRFSLKIIDPKDRVRRPGLKRR